VGAARVGNPAPRIWRRKALCPVEPVKAADWSADGAVLAIGTSLDHAGFVANRSAKLIAPKRDGQVVLSSPITPGFFVLGRDQNEAAARYLQIVKTLGPMPMSDTQLGAAEPEPKLPGRPRALYLGFAFDTNWGDRWMYQVLERRLPVRFIHPRSIEEHWNKVSPNGGATT
jgi:hypothetical protein